MKKKLFLLIPLLIVLSGCSTMPIIGKLFNKTNEQKIEVADKKVETAKTDIIKNDTQRIELASTMATGTDRALTKMTNPPVEIIIAMEMNDRVLNILGNPSLSEANKIKKIVDELTSSVELERKRGLKHLEEKDKEINTLQAQRDELEIVLKNKIDKFNTLAKTMAITADKNKAEIDEWNKWFGLGAVVYGIKKFLTTCTIFLLISGVLFLALRILSTMNPIAASIFDIFNIMMGFVLDFIKAILPKSFKFANFTPTDDYVKYKNVLLKYVDVIEEMKSHDEIMPDDKDYKFKDFLDKSDKALGDTDKKVYEDVKKELRWKV